MVKTFWEPCPVSVAPAEPRATFILGPARVHNHQFSLVSFVAIRLGDAVKHIKI